MLVRVRVLFRPITDEAREEMRSLANSLTTERSRIELTDDAKPGWLSAVFTMPTEPQYRAVPKIENALEFHVYRREDSAFLFPYTEEERRRADRKLEQARARRKAKRASQSKADAGEPSTSIVRARTS